MLKFGSKVKILVDIEEESAPLKEVEGFVVGIYPEDEYPIVVGIEGDGNGEMYGFQEEELEEIDD
jgi:hypothetical protein